MSPQLRTRRDGTVRPARYRSLEPWVLVWLTVVWMALWGDLSLLSAASGLLVAIVACLVFPLPPLRLDVRVRPLAMLWLAMRFVADVVVSSIQVSRVVLRPQRPLRNAVIEVNLRTPSDFVLTIVAEMTCLIPGSLVVEARRSTHTLFLHVLDVGDLAGVERFRQSVLDQEARLVRALGGHTDHLDDVPTLPPGAVT
ncbi:MAG TPA: Na+/H+ antiporter subunit E [Nocardioides sp.]|uniref:Na+/H+ antiporter subunit E n=1 Tax=Nocardioides sp. TaxID=35761 RepID=UPI002D80386F|nr:Na+/H+ antiporter subunit E [Nocardioides sp.]HET6651073.1 Na+/H+ antiporter subunit E [Nocardioides sp.]